MAQNVPLLSQKTLNYIIVQLRTLANTCVWYWIIALLDSSAPYIRLRIKSCNCHILWLWYVLLCCAISANTDNIFYIGANIYILKRILLNNIVHQWRLKSGAGGIRTKKQWSDVGMLGMSDDCGYMWGWWTICEDSGQHMMKTKQNQISGLRTWSYWCTNNTWINWRIGTM